jgi:hypothetical protein
MVTSLNIIVFNIKFLIVNHSIVPKRYVLLTACHRQDIPGHIPNKGHFSVLAGFVAHISLASLDLDFLLILSILAKDRPPMLGWGSPKFHN